MNRLSVEITIILLLLFLTNSIRGQWTETERQELFGSSAVSIHNYRDRLNYLTVNLESIKLIDIHDTNKFISDIRTIITDVPFKTKIIMNTENDSGAKVVEFETTVHHGWFVYKLEKGISDKSLESNTILLIVEQLKNAEETVAQLIETGSPVISENYILKIREIKSRQEFMPIPEKENRNILSEFFRWLAEQISKLLKNLFPNFTKPPQTAPVKPFELTGVGNLIVYIFYILAAIFLLVIGYRLYKLYKTKKHSEKETVDIQPLPILDPGEPSDPDYHQDQADRWVADGEYRKALRHLVLSVLLYLDKRDIVRLHFYKTNQEYLLSVNDLPNLDYKSKLSDGLKLLFNYFDRVWWGFRTINDSDYKICQESAKKIKSGFKSSAD